MVFKENSMPKIISSKTRWNSVKQILINAKLKTGKMGKKTELTGRSPLGRQQS
jgi:hypothetical protein